MKAVYNITSYAFSILKIVLIFAIVLTLVSCEDKPTEPAPTPEVIIPESTKPVSSEDFNNNLVGFSTDSSVITMNEDGMKSYNVSENDVLFLPTEFGLLRKVTSVATNGDNLVVSTTQGTLEDAVEKGSLTFNENILNNGLGETIFKLPGIKETITTLEKTNEPQLTINGAVVLYNLDGDTTTTDDQVKLDIEYSNLTVFSGEIDIDRFTLQNLHLGYIVTEEKIISTTIGPEVPGLSKDTVFYKKTFKPFTIWMGSLPVVVVPELTLTAGIEIEVAAGVVFGITSETTKNTGIRYENGNWTTYRDIERNLGWLPPELDLGVSAKASVTAELQFKVYNVVSPYLSLEGYAKAELEFPSSEWAISLGTVGKAGVKGQIWKRVLFDFNAEIFAFEWLIVDGYLTNEAPTAIFNVNPQNGTTNTMFNFDASGCHDREDPDDSLEVRWDWEGDGSWDTEYSTNKTETHQYSDTGHYNPKLEVKDSGEKTHDTSGVVIVDPILLVAYYPFNNNTEDESGNGNNGIPYGEIGFVTDRFGNENKACAFDGIDDFIQVFNDPSLNFAGDFSLCYWAKTSEALNVPIISKFEQYSAGYRMFLDEEGVLEFFIRESIGEYSRLYSYGQDFIDGNWHFIVGIRRDDSLEIWVDGTLNASKNCIDSNLTNYATLKFGRSDDPQFPFYKGDMDDIRIFNYALKANDISDLFHEGVSLK